MDRLIGDRGSLMHVGSNPTNELLMLQTSQDAHFDPCVCAYNGHVRIRTGPGSNEKRWAGLMKCDFFASRRWLGTRIPGEHTAPGCAIDRRQADRGSVML